MRRSLQVLIFIGIILGVIYLLRDLFGSQFTALYSFLTSLGVLSVSIMVFLENRDPAKTLAWLLLLALIPAFGILFYLLFGRNYWKQRTFNKKAEQDAQIYTFVTNRLSFYEKELEKFSDDKRRLIDLAGKLAYSPISFATYTRVLINGDETFSAILHELEKAEQYIHLEYYIYRNDEIGTKIKDLLVRKAQDGIEVRFLYDAVGSYKLPDSFIQEMKSAGIDVAAFHPVRFPLLSNKMNYRNHRKIIVIDGKTGFVGGLNVGDEYLGKAKEFGFWRDTHLLLKGEAVLPLQIIFLRDWNYTTGKRLDESAYLDVTYEQDQERGAVQIIASGPDQEWKSASHLFFTMISRAKHSIWIATPYFIPDENILTAIKVAALSGIDVKILFPKKPDHWLPYLASHSYFEELIEAGVEIYEYTKGFMHSKILIVDGEVSSVGTVNMDMRSFNLNFEVSALLYGEEKNRRLVTHFEADLRDSEPIIKEQYRKGIMKRFLESAARLLSPLL